MKKLFTLFFVLIFIQSAFTQERWSVDKSKTSKPPLSNYQILPGNFTKWENPNKSDRVIYTQQGRVTVAPNIRVLPNSNQQDEVILVRHPTNPNIMFGSANTTVGTAFRTGILYNNRRRTDMVWN
ncbi:MAG: hypothetical protein R2942_16855 [Ignavibacteria bacterium]